MEKTLLKKYSCNESVIIAIFLFVLAPFSLFAQGTGFPNVTQQKGALLSDYLGVEGGRTAVIAYHQGYLITQYEAAGSKSGSDGLARYYDISNLNNITTKTFDAGWNSSVGAHGYWQEGGAIRGFGDWTFTGDRINRIQNESLAGGTMFHPFLSSENNNFRWPGRGLLFQPFHMSMYWSYSDTNYNSGLFKGTKLLSEWNPVEETGVIGHPYMIGNYLYYLSDQSDTGIAVYDISRTLSNPGAKPQLVGLFNAPVDPSNPSISVGGYWPEIWSGNGKLKAFFPDREDGIHIVDITDPANMFLELSYDHPRFKEWYKNPDASYVQFQDEYAFTDRLKINMETLTVESVIDPASAGLSVSQFSLPIGNLLVTGGLHIDPLGPNSQAGAIWAHQSAPDTKAPTVGYHVPKNHTLNYNKKAAITLLIHETLRTETIINGETFMLRPVLSASSYGDPVSGRIAFSFNDVLTFTPDEALLANTTYQVDIIAGGIQDAVGNGMQAFNYRFSTGNDLILSPGDTLHPPTVIVPSPGDDTPVASPEDPDSGMVKISVESILANRSGLLRRIRLAVPSDISTRNARSKRKVVRIRLSLNGSRLLQTRVRLKRNLRITIKNKKKLKKLQEASGNTLYVDLKFKGTLIGEGQDSF